MTHHPPGFTIAVVDDDRRILESLKNLLESADYAVRSFASAAALLESACLAEIGCLILAPLEVRTTKVSGVTETILPRICSSTGAASNPVQYKTPATAVKATRFTVTPFRLSTVAITPEVLRECYWTMVSIETGSNAGALRHGSIFVNARVRKRACVKGLMRRAPQQAGGRGRYTTHERQTCRCIRSGKHFCVNSSPRRSFSGARTILELQTLQEALPKFREFGANVVAISPQTSSNSRKSTRTNALEFPILSDAHNNLAAAFGLRVDSAIMVSGLRCGVPRQAASASGSRAQIVVMQRCERIDECFECFDYRRVRRVKRW